MKKKKKVRNFYDYIVQQIPLLKLPFSINSSNQIKSHTKTSIKHQIKGKKNKQQTIKTKRTNTKIKKKKKTYRKIGNVIGQMRNIFKKVTFISSNYLSVRFLRCFHSVGWSELEIGGLRRNRNGSVRRRSSEIEDVIWVGIGSMARWKRRSRNRTHRRRKRRERMRLYGRGKEEEMLVEEEEAVFIGSREDESVYSEMF